MLWKDNLGDQIVETDHTDSFYYSDDMEYIYSKHKILKEDKIRILDFKLIEHNILLHLWTFKTPIFTKNHHKKNIHNVLYLVYNMYPPFV